MLSKKCASVKKDKCVACGACLKVCPRDSIAIYKGMYALVNGESCIGCGKCAQICPANAIEVIERGEA